MSQNRQRRTVPRSATDPERNGHEVMPMDGTTDPSGPQSLELPPHHAAAEKTAVDSWQRYTRAVVTRLTLGITAILLGLMIGLAKLESCPVARSSGCVTKSGVTHARWVACIGTALVFLCAALLEQQLLETRPQERCYDARALADRVTSHSWCFAVKAAPFAGSCAATICEQFVAAMEHLCATSRVELGPMGGHSVITLSMGELREAALETRRIAYRDLRLIPRRKYCQEEARNAADRQRRCRRLLYCLYPMGVCAAMIILITPAMDIGILGIFSAVLGTVAAWLAVRRYDNTERIYSEADRRLLGVEERFR